jgi:hypothetical protein
MNNKKIDNMMKSKKRFFLLIVSLVMMGATGWADDYSYLTIQQNDAGNTEASVALSSLRKITFSNGAMELYNASGASLGTYTLSDLNMMYFSATPTGIQNANTNQFSAILSNGTLKINATVGSRISLYQTCGALVKSFSSAAEESEINMSSLPKGVYLLKVNSKVTKILNR